MPQKAWFRLSALRVTRAQGRLSLPRKVLLWQSERQQWAPRASVSRHGREFDGESSELVVAGRQPKPTTLRQKRLNHGWRGSTRIKPLRIIKEIHFDHRGIEITKGSRFYINASSARCERRLKRHALQPADRSPPPISGQNARAHSGLRGAARSGVELATSRLWDVPAPCRWSEDTKVSS